MIHDDLKLVYHRNHRISTQRFGYSACTVSGGDGWPCMQVPNPYVGAGGIGHAVTVQNSVWTKHPRLPVILQTNLEQNSDKNYSQQSATAALNIIQILLYNNNNSQLSAVF